MAETQTYRTMAAGQEPISFIVTTPLLPLMLFLNALQTTVPMMPAAQLPAAQSKDKKNGQWIIETKPDGSIKSLVVTRDERCQKKITRL